MMVLMAIALIKAIYLDGKREAAGISTTAPTEPDPTAAPAE